jgi:hypothetical protein
MITEKHKSDYNHLTLSSHRYDLLCLEGIAQALRVFNWKQEIPTYKVANISRESMIKMHVKPEVVISEIHKLLIGLYFHLSATLILWHINSLIFFSLADVFNSSLCCLCCFEGYNI